jgi:hypothetical protein
MKLHAVEGSESKIFQFSSTSKKRAATRIDASGDRHVKPGWWRPGLGLLLLRETLLMLLLPVEIRKTESSRVQ